MPPVVFFGHLGYNGLHQLTGVTEMTKLEHLKATKAWAEKWLATPEAELPGTLTHEKCNEVLEDVEMQLIDHLGITVNDGKLVACYV